MKHHCFNFCIKTIARNTIALFTQVWGALIVETTQSTNN